MIDCNNSVSLFMTLSPTAASTHWDTSDSVTHVSRTLATAKSSPRFAAERVTVSMYAFCSSGCGKYLPFVYSFGLAPLFIVAVFSIEFPCDKLDVAFVSSLSSFSRCVSVLKQN